MPHILRPNHTLLLIGILLIRLSEHAECFTNFGLFVGAKIVLFGEFGGARFAACAAAAAACRPAASGLGKVTISRVSEFVAI